MMFIVIYFLQRKRNVQVYNWNYNIDHDEAIDMQDDDELPAWALPPTPVKPQPSPPSNKTVGRGGGGGAVTTKTIMKQRNQVTPNWTDQPQCQICASLGRIAVVKSKAIVYLSCGHILCRNCLIADKLKACPYCRIHQERVVVSDTAKFLVLRSVTRASNEIVKRNIKEMSIEEYRHLTTNFSKPRLPRPSSQTQIQQISRPRSSSNQRLNISRPPSQSYLFSRPQSAISNITSKSSLMDDTNDDWRSGSEIMNQMLQNNQNHHNDNP